MASSSSSTSTRKGHDVFLSFRGEDTRDNFVSHLLAKLEEKKIPTFMDNYLKRGEEISTSLLNAIEESRVSVVVFSEDYASSTRCLEELVKILECKRMNGLIVVPVFYRIHASDVRKQTGSFDGAFSKHVLEEDMEKVQKWRAALEEAAGITGWVSGKKKSDSELVQEIVATILNELHQMSQRENSTPRDSAGLVGMDKRVEKILSALDMHSQGVRRVGLWGMGGIGKTTVAKHVFNIIKTQFERSHFAEDVKGQLKTGGMDGLRRSLLSEVLGPEIVTMGYVSFEDSLIKDRLCRSKVLIVLDNVDNVVELKELLPMQHNYKLFGAGSKIIVTSRDNQVLKNVVDETYEVEGLNRVEALQLFSLHAFKRDQYPSIKKYQDLSARIVHFANGNPLALIVLGSSLDGQSEEHWRSALNKLGRIQDRKIENVLRISYDELDVDQQNIFLDIAFFFNWKNRNLLTHVLDACYTSAHADIGLLLDRALITINSFENLQMHDLLQEMAYSIVREETDLPARRSRLCDHEEICYVLQRNRGTDAIQGISLNSSNIDMQLEPDTFGRMDRLKYLHFHSTKDGSNKVHPPPGGLNFPESLRYIHWDNFSSKSFARNFCARNLVELVLRESKMEQLWTGKLDLMNLRHLDLSKSSNLKRIPDLSKAQKLEDINLGYCESLIEVHSSVGCLEKLETLNLEHCQKLKRLPRTTKQIKLFYLLLPRKSITTCPQLSTKLTVLNLQQCSQLQKFPEIPENVESLYLDGTAIKKVPSSIEFLTRLSLLSMKHCKQLRNLPSSIWKLQSLQHLYLRDCPKLESIPEILRPMESLLHLDVGETGITTLPSSVKHLKYLQSLEICGTAIKTLAVLPPSLQSLNANHCGSLETLSDISNLDVLHLANCIKLDEKALMLTKQMEIQSGNIRHGLNILLRGSEVPQWLHHQGVGSSLTIELPSNCPPKGIIFCVVFASPVPVTDLPASMVNFECFCHPKSNSAGFIFCKKSRGLKLSKLDASDHMLLWYTSVIQYHLRGYMGKEVTFEFYPDGSGEFLSWPSVELARKIQEHCTVKKCGVYLLLDEDEASNSKNLSDPNGSRQSWFKREIMHYVWKTVKRLNPNVTCLQLEYVNHSCLNQHEGRPSQSDIPFDFCGDSIHFALKNIDQSNPYVTIVQIESCKCKL